MEIYLQSRIQAHQPISGQSLHSNCIIFFCTIRTFRQPSNSSIFHSVHNFWVTVLFRKISISFYLLDIPLNNNKSKSKLLIITCGINHCWKLPLNPEIIKKKYAWGGGWKPGGMEVFIWYFGVSFYLRLLFWTTWAFISLLTKFWGLHLVMKHTKW